MPVYELVLALQKLERQKLKEALKRTANYIFEEEGIIRKIENLGFRQLPYAIRAKGKKHTYANYFIFSYNAGVKEPKLVLEKLSLDLDVVRAKNFLCSKNPLDLHLEKPKPECTLHIDLLPAPLRPTVIALQKIGEMKKRRRNEVSDGDFLLH